jgi:hypothetical protein
LASPLRGAREAVERAPRHPPGEHLRGGADAARIPGEHDSDEGTAAPVDDAGVVTGATDPAGLVDDRRLISSEQAPEPARLRVRQQIEQEARVRRHEAAAEPSRKESLPARREVQLAEKSPEVRGGRPFADEARLVRLHLVAAVHVRVAKAERSQGRVHERRAATRRAAEPGQELVRRTVVRRDQHPAEQTIEASPVRRATAVNAQHLERDRHLQRRRRRERDVFVPLGAGAGAQVSDEDRARPRKGAGERPHHASEAAVPAASPRRRARLGCLRQPEHGPYPRRRAASTNVERRHRQPEIAGREPDVEVEGRPHSVQIALRHDPPIDADED